MAQNGSLLRNQGHVALDRYLGPGYNTLLLRLIGDLNSVCLHRLSHTLPCLLDSQATKPNFYPNACLLCCDPAGARTHDLPHKRQTHLAILSPCQDKM